MTLSDDDRALLDEAIDTLLDLMDGKAVDAAELHAIGALCLSLARQQREDEGEGDEDGDEDVQFKDDLPELDNLGPAG
ncbi:MAG: hypothetical protein ACYCSN_17265 [Acidobacteriaceae bacterium]